MPQEVTRFADEIYSANLQTINHIKFSHREVDILATILSGKETKEIAAFLSIAPRTVDNGLYNISKRINAKTRQEIIEFIKQSPEFPYIQEYYRSLSLQVFFEKQLTKISKLIEAPFPACAVVYWPNEGIDNSLVQLLKKHLELAGITISIKAKDTDQNIHEVIKLIKEEQDSYILFILSGSELEQLRAEGKDLFRTNNNQLYQKTIFLLLDSTKPLNSFDELQNCILLNPSNLQHYYGGILETLEKLFPHVNFSLVKNEIKQHSRDSLKLLETPPFSLKNRAERMLKAFFSPSKKYFSYIRFNRIAIILLSLSFLSIALFLMKVVSEKQAFVSSDLSLPTQEILLKRPQLMVELGRKFKGAQGIQKVALVGMGGAGKTTLARDFARSLETPLVWEINAETRETLTNSFENLAYALAKTEEEKKILKILQSINNTQAREEKLLLFIKERLKAYPSWFLIYDNVEKLTDIQKFVPHNPAVWGKGKVLIITRDANIEHSKHINSTLFVKELTPDDKFTLFVNITNNGNLEEIIPLQKEKIFKFLSSIPSFPLDVSIAASYIKTTNISYDKYLEYLHKDNKEFETIQQNVLRDVGEEIKTRYSIIALSLDQLIAAHPDFKDLLLFICLLDPQDIPRGILEAYKNNIIVDHFIYHLKKYSLLIGNNSSLLTIHRSTQKVSLAYLMQHFNLRESPQLQSIVDTFEHSLAKPIRDSDIAKMRALISHAEAFLNHDFLTPLMQGTIGEEIGCIYFFQGDYTKAQQILEESLQKLKNASQQKHNRIAQALRFLANIHKDKGYYEKAKDLYEKSLLIYDRYLPQHHVDIVRVKTFLGFVYRKLGFYKEAKELLEQTLLKYKQQFPDDHNSIAWISLFLGNFYTEVGHYEKAKTLLEQCLQTYKKLLPANHIFVAWVSASLADTERKLGHYESAKKLFAQSLYIYKQHLPKNHIFMAWASALLGNLESDLGRYKEAKQLLEKSLLRHQEHFGHNHIETARILTDLGYVHLLEGQVKKAEEMMQQALRIFQQNKHPDRYIPLEGLADLYLKQARQNQNEHKIEQAYNLRKQSIHYLEQALAIVKTNLPEESPHIARIQEKLDKTESHSFK